MQKGRWRICEELARHHPFSVQEIYDVYEFVRERRLEKKLTFISIFENVHVILCYAQTFAVSPMQAAQHSMKADLREALRDKALIEACDRD